MNVNGDSQLVRSRWRYVHRSGSVPALLDALGIEYSKAGGKDFWEANKEHLAYLYQELQNEARPKFWELHPDKGGDGHAFGNFVSAYSNAVRQFKRYGATSVIPAPPEAPVMFAAKRTKPRHLGRRAPDEFRNPAKAMAIMKLLATGISNIAVCRQFPKVTPEYVVRVRRAMERVCYCKCGRPGNHKGWCVARPHPNPAAFRGRKPGFTVGAETRKKMSIAHLGLRHTPEESRKIGKSSRLHQLRNPQPRGYHGRFVHSFATSAT